jgi:hypothetical protein
LTKKKDTEAKEAEEFEAKVAALLKVDPSGIVGQSGKKKGQNGGK